MRTALYQHTPVHRRGRHHHELGIAIEDRHAGRITERLDDLAFHFARSSDDADTVKLIRYAREAGGRAMTQVAYDEAAGFYQLALQAIERRGSSPDPELLLATLVELGRAQRRGHLPDGRTTLLRAADMAAALGDRDQLIAAALADTRTVFWTGEATDPERSLVFERALHQLDPGDSAERAQLTACLSVERYLAGDEDDHVLLADEALAISRRMQDPTTLGFVLHYRNLTMWRPDTVAERLALAKEMRDLSQGSALASRFELGTWAFPGFNAAIEAGDLAFADYSLTEVVGLALEARYVEPHLQHTRLVPSTRAAIAGRLDESMRLADEMLVLGRGGHAGGRPGFHLGLPPQRLPPPGRLAETIDALAWAAEHYPEHPERSVRAGRHAGRVGSCPRGHGRAQPILANGLATVPVRPRLADFVCYAAARGVGRRRPTRREILRPLLLPYAAQCANNGTVWLRAGQRLPRRCSTSSLGDHDAADARFAAAAEAHRALPAPVALTWDARRLGRGVTQPGRPRPDDGDEDDAVDERSARAGTWPPGSVWIACTSAMAALDGDERRPTAPGQPLDPPPVAGPGLDRGDGGDVRARGRSGTRRGRSPGTAGRRGHQRLPGPPGGDPAGARRRHRGHRLLRAVGRGHAVQRGRAVRRGPHPRDRAVLQRLRVAVERDDVFDARGMATKFHLPSGREADLVMMTLPVFFVRTPDEFLAFAEESRPSAVPPSPGGRSCSTCSSCGPGSGAQPGIDHQRRARHAALREPPRLRRLERLLMTRW